MKSDAGTLDERELKARRRFWSKKKKKKKGSLENLLKRLLRGTRCVCRS